MFYGIRKKIILILLCAAAAAGCVKETQSTADRLKSKNVNTVKKAFADAWRLGDAANAAGAAAFLENAEFKETAAFALAFMNSESVDKIVLSLMKNARNKEAHLLYFYLILKKRRHAGSVFETLKKISEQGSGAEKISAYMTLTAAENNDMYAEKMYLLLEKNHRELMPAVKKEILIFTGKSGSAEGLKAAEKIGNITEMKPFYNYAKNRVAPREKPESVRSERVILHNPYWKKSEKNPVF
ncbi:MAG: hypothetical protein ACOC4H_02775, partial [bacterium]